MSVVKKRGDASQEVMHASSQNARPITFDVDCLPMSKIFMASNMRKFPGVRKEKEE